MIVIKESDIFDSECEVLVCPCNCMGIMGAGLARQFKNKFPEMFIEYQDWCRKGKLKIGSLHCWTGNPWIINFPTKIHWKNSSKLEWIEEGLFHLAAFVKDCKIQSIALPALGCGLGGLLFESVLKFVQDFDLDVCSSEMVVVEVYKPQIFWK